MPPHRRLAGSARTSLRRTVAGSVRMPLHRRLAAWALTGPPGHLAAGVVDWLTLLAHWASARARGRDPWAQR